MAAIKASARGIEAVKRARINKGWAINDFRWLEEASQFLGVSWADKGYLADGISEGTWKRFLAGKSAVNVPAFKAFCLVLGLNWQEIVERNHDRDWGADFDVSTFIGRERELEQINRYLLEDRCRLITLLGMGGVGKSALAIEAARMMEDRFDFIFRRNLGSVASLGELLDDLSRFLGYQAPANLEDNLSEKLRFLIEQLRSSRCLLILDNAEYILQKSNDNSYSSLVTKYRSQDRNYANFLQAIAQVAHQSCALVTSREPLPGFAAFEGNNLAVRCLPVAGLSNRAGVKLIQFTANFPNSKQLEDLVEYYRGNPFALKVVARAIRDSCQGNLRDLMREATQGNLVFSEIYSLFQSQFFRLTNLERQIMYWLAIEREPVLLNRLPQKLIFKVLPGELIQALAALQKRSFMIKKGNYLSLPKIIAEYVIYELIDRLGTEIATGKIALLNQIALVKYSDNAGTKKSDKNQIYKPIIERANAFLKTPHSTKFKLQQIANNVRFYANASLNRGYLTENINALIDYLENDRN